MVDLGAPPLEVVVGVLKGEEDEYPHECRTGIECRRQHVVILLPPPLAVPEDEVVEDGAGDEPAGDVGGRCRRHPGKPIGDDRHVDERDPLLLRESPAQQPHRHRQYGAHDEEPHQVPVQPVLAEEPPRSDEAPDHRSVEGDPVLGTRPGAVRVQSLYVADVLDAVQHPPCHRQIHHAGHHRADQLGSVHAARRDLHVVAELEVGEEGQCVHGADPAVDLEDQVGDGLAGQRVADHELCDDVVPRLLVGGGLDDANGQGDDEGEREGEEHSPPRQLHLLLPHEAHEQRHRHAAGQQHQEPPLRHLLVLLHQLGVHVQLRCRADRGPALPPHVGAVEEQHVHDGGREPEEPGADGDGEEWAEVQLPVVVIGGHIEVEVLGEHLGGVVLLACGREELVGEDREFPGVEGVEPPVAERDDDVDEHDEADGRVGDGRPRRHQRAAVVRGDARPVQGECADAQAVIPGADLLRRDAAWPHPARPREEGQDREEVAGEGVVGEAREEEDEEEAHPRRSLGRLPTLLRLVQRPEE